MARTIGNYCRVALYCCAAIFAIIDIAYRSNIYVSDIIRGKWILSILAYVFLGCLWSPVPIDALENSLAMLAIIVTIFVLTSEMRTAEDHVIFLYWVIFSCLFTSLAGVEFLPMRAIHQAAYDLNVDDLQSSVELIGDWRGGFIHKNYAAGFLMMALPILFTSKFRGVFGLVSGIYLVGTSVFLHFADSFTSVIASVIGIPLALVLYRLSRSTSGPLIGWLIMAIMVIFPIFSVYVIEPYTGATISDRTLIWDANLKLGLTHPFFGAGTQGVYSGLAGLENFTTNEFVARVGSHSHNGFMETFGQLGLVGVLLVMAMLVNAIAAVFRLVSMRPRTEAIWGARALLLCLFCALIRACVEPDFIDKRLHWFVIIFIVIAIQRALGEAINSSLLPQSESGDRDLNEP
ncbi:O-antigen ligase family protein [Sphingobium sp. AR-3-1]|uniref:O-antigen ligase family protein n=1 Tax=Sphingobium psychrophilum TaxID=2728834 RepID=A0A7X9X084_9SPHN|nr:O-antigen ligase family protein [Sphingobium psychrophilum]NML13186.1 O-antigen ligase family protein [Sphingobium psychrophilum]